MENRGGVITEQVFTRVDSQGIPSVRGSYQFILISTDYEHFESTLLTVVTNAINNTMVECTGSFLRDTTTIKIAGQVTIYFMEHTLLQ